MNKTTSRTILSPGWPIVPPDPRLLTLAELRKRCGITTGGSLRKWIIKQGFRFVLARLAEGNQLTLCVTPEKWAKIAERRRALGFTVH
jgi:hypothetical protein